MRLKIIFISLFCSLSVQLLAQSPTHNTYAVDSDYKAVTSWVLFKDSRGIIWSGPTGNGAMGFNGKSFFTLNEEDGLAGNIVLSFAEDNNGNLWMGCQGQGISVFDGKKFTNYNVNDNLGLNSNNIMSMHQHSNGEFYLGAYQGGFHRFKNGKFEVIGDSSTTVYCMLEDEDGTLWLGTKDHGLGRFDGTEIRYFGSDKEIYKSIILSLAFDENQNILIPTKVGLFRYNKKEDFYRFNESDGFPATYAAERILILENGDYFMSINEAPYMYSKGRLKQVNKYGKSIYPIMGLTQDQTGNVWLATNGSGLIQHFLNGISVISGPEKRGIRVLDQLPNGKIAYANEGAIYTFSNGQGQLIYEFENTLDNLRDLCYKDSINLYLGGDFGLIHFNMLTKKPTLVRDGALYGMTAESDSSLVFCQLDGGYRYNIHTQKSTKITPEGESKPYASSAIGKNGEIYFGSYTEGDIIVITANDTIKYNENNGLSTDAKVALQVNSKGQLWYLAINGEFGYLDKGNFTPFQLNSIGEADGFVIDKHDNLWITGLKGIVHVKLNGNQIVSRQFFGLNDGVHEANSQMGQGFCGIDGRIYIPKHDAALYVIDPEKTKQSTEIPKLYIESAMGKDYSDLDSSWYQGYSPLFGVPENLVLPYESNNLSLILSCVYFSMPDSVLYTYKLNDNDDWSLPQSSSLISFTNISSGSYALKLKAISPSGESEIVTYNFTVLTPWFQSWWFYTIVILALVLFVLLIVKWRLSKLQKDKILLEKLVIERTKEVSAEKEKVSSAYASLEEKNQEILDSIAYAKRIQSAILPPETLMSDLLPDNFVLYKPKDVVAGDFYWLEKVEDTVLVAAADCTGHGVPGAMVSVICNGALNRSVREFGLTEPGKILDKAREIVIQEFEKSEEDVKDGMDIALCAIKGKNLYYSGANNPLWILRNGEIIETKADKQPIGKFEAAQAFTTHETTLQKGDTVYIFTDGYVDQFGGDRGKKFKAKSLKDLLIGMQDKSLNEQKLALNQQFEIWRGVLEQVDDVCIIGIRV